MIIHHGFDELPPKALLMQILDNKSKIYLFLWERKNEHFRCIFNWNELTKYFNKNTFRTNLRRLNEIGLISYHETENTITIELVSWDEIND